MSCLEDKPKKWVLPGKFACEKCFATHDKKSKLCKPARNKSKKPRKPK